MENKFKYSQSECDAVYKTIYQRRDVRGEYLPDPVPDEVLARLIHAAHHGPSVGFMQPWDFIVVKDKDLRQQVKAAFERAHAEAALMFSEEKRPVYSGLKLEGILEAPLNLLITCDTRRNGPIVIGRTAIPEMDRFSVVCAVQNLWLAARCEGLGVGWVSIIHNSDLESLFKLPEGVLPIAYLCLGQVRAFHEKPELEKAKWLPRMDVEKLIHRDHWENQGPDPGLTEALQMELERLKKSNLA